MVRHLDHARDEIVAFKKSVANDEGELERVLILFESVARKASEARGERDEALNQVQKFIEQLTAPPPSTAKYVHPYASNAGQVVSFNFSLIESAENLVERNHRALSVRRLHRRPSPKLDPSAVHEVPEKSNGRKRT